MSSSSNHSGPGNHVDNTDHNTAESGLALSYGQRNVLIVALLIGLIVLLSITLLYLICPVLFTWIRRRRRPQSQTEQNDTAEDESRVQRRYETIEGWLISKRVRAHTEECTKIQKQFCHSFCVTEPEDVDTAAAAISPKSSIKAASSYDSAETANTAPSSDEELGEERECPICMEPFQVGDVVSWSPNVDVSCRHVFHHECIKEWMLQSANCPCCRELILPIDEEGLALERPLLKELCRKRARLAATSYYCQVDGLVCFDTRGKKCDRKTAEILRAATSCQIQPKDLVERRGHRRSTGDGDGGSVTCGTPDDDDDDNDNDNDNDNNSPHNASHNNSISPTNSGAGQPEPSPQHPQSSPQPPFQDSAVFDDEDDDDADETGSSTMLLSEHNSNSNSSNDFLLESRTILIGDGQQQPVIGEIQFTENNDDIEDDTTDDAPSDELAV